MVELLIVLFVVEPAHGALQCKSWQKRSSKRLCHSKLIALIVAVEVALVYVYVGCRTTSTIQVIAVFIAIAYELESHTTVHEVAGIKYRVVIQPVGTGVVKDRVRLQPLCNLIAASQRKVVALVECALYETVGIIQTKAGVVAATVVATRDAGIIVLSNIRLASVHFQRVDVAIENVVVAYGVEHLAPSLLQEVSVVVGLAQNVVRLSLRQLCTANTTGIVCTIEV